MEHWNQTLIRTLVSREQSQKIYVGIPYLTFEKELIRHDASLIIQKLPMFADLNILPLEKLLPKRPWTRVDQDIEFEREYAQFKETILSKIINSFSLDSITTPEVFCGLEDINFHLLCSGLKKMPGVTITNENEVLIE
jgi:hypothetical protein